jgi:Transcription factor S-II (TFIIS)
MSEPPVPPGTHPISSPCLMCDSIEHVLRVDVPDEPHIHYYRCRACGHHWATSLRGDRILTGQDDDEMLFI